MADAPKNPPSGGTTPPAAAAPAAPVSEVITPAAAAPAAPVLKAVVGAPVHVASQDEEIKRGSFFNYSLKDGGRNLKGEKCDIDTLALVIGSKVKSRFKLDETGAIVYIEKEINTTKGLQTVKQPVSETYPVYSVLLYCDAWQDPKFVSSVEASALTAL